jgi:hypothetical protein
MTRWSYGPQPSAALAGAVVGVCGALFLLKPKVVASPDGGPTVPGLPSGSVGLGEIPLAAIYVGAILGTVLTGFLLVVLVTKGITLFFTRGGPLVRAYRFVVPNSPLVKMATGIMLLMGVMLLGVAMLPGAIGDLGESGAVSGADDIAGDPNAGVFAGDVVATRPAAPATNDTDGDGIPDAWERAGETPSGAALPGADPQRKDLYVVVGHGEESSPLSDSERQQLRSIWDRMPVSNPDGSTGIRLHLTTEQGPVSGATVGVNGTEYRGLYSPDRLGPRRCTYRYVALGSVSSDRTAVRVDAPGYAGVVDGQLRSEYTGSASFRVAATTHALLHMVAGELSGGYHTSDGWLTTGSPTEQLSRTTADHLNATGFRSSSAYAGC